MDAVLDEAKRKTEDLLQRWRDGENPRLAAKDLRALKFIEQTLRQADEIDAAGQVMKARLQLQAAYSRAARAGGQ